MKTLARTEDRVQPVVDEIIYVDGVPFTPSMFEAFRRLSKRPAVAATVEDIAALRDRLLGL